MCFFDSAKSIVYLLYVSVKVNLHGTWWKRERERKKTAESINGISDEDGAEMNQCKYLCGCTRFLCMCEKGTNFGFCEYLTKISLTSRK